METGDMPSDPLARAIPPKAELDPLHPSPWARGCCVRAPGQPSLLSPQLSAFQNAGSASPGPSGAGAAWAGGNNPCASQTPAALGLGSRFVELGVTSSASSSREHGRRTACPSPNLLDFPAVGVASPPRGLAWLREPLKRCRVRNKPAVLRIYLPAGRDILCRGAAGSFGLRLQASAIIQPASKPCAAAPRHLPR